MAYLFGYKVNKEEFLKKSIPTNRFLLRICAVFSLLIECFNIIRVLFFSASGLGTQNNRIYFYFYFASLLCSVVFLIWDVGIKMSDKARHRLYMIDGSILLLWNTVFNVYDIYKSGAVGNFTIVTAVVAFSSLLIMRPVYALSNLAANYLIFALFLCRNFSSGEVINFTITTLLCATICFVRYKHVCIEVSQEKELGDIQQELSETRQSLRLSAEQHELIRKSGNYVTFQWDIKKDIIRFSKEWTEWFDTSEEITNVGAYIKNVRVLSDDTKSDLLNCMQKIKSKAGFQKYRLSLPMKTGRKGWFEFQVTAQTDAHGKPIFGIGMLSDVTDEEEKLCRLEEGVRLDLFTGVFNKAEIERYGKNKLNELRKGETLAAIILDIDDFKSINDNYGHPVGDYVLKSVAELMLNKAPKGTRVGRIGGDEFLALLATNDVQVLYEYGRKLVEEIPEIRWRGKDIGVSCSIGFSTADSEKPSYQELYRKADDALLQAKMSRKRQILRYSAEAWKPQE